MAVVETNSESMSIINCNDEALSYLPKKYRYIQNSLNGSNKNNSSHYVELKAFVGTDNVAYNKTVSIIAGSIEYGSPRGVQGFVDGDTNSNNYVGMNAGVSTLQIDLGAEYELNSITMWHYYTDSRIYNGNVLKVSKDGVNWDTLYDSSVDGTYSENSSGKTITIQ